MVAKSSFIAFLFTDTKILHYHPCRSLTFFYRRIYKLVVYFLLLQLIYHPLPSLVQLKEYFCVSVFAVSVIRYCQIFCHKIYKSFGTLCFRVKPSWRFERSYCLHYQGQVEECLQAQAVLYLTLKIKALRSFETSGTTHPATRRHIREDLNLRNIAVRTTDVLFMDTVFRQYLSFRTYLLNYLPHYASDVFFFKVVYLQRGREIS
jgi:hypothetical protein